MPLLQLMIVAIVAMAGLVTLRLARVRAGRPPLPEGRGRRLFLIAFVVVPPIALGFLTQPAGASGWVRGLASLPIYIAIVAGLVILMWIAAGVVRLVAPRRSHQVLLLALVGSEVSRDVPTNPPVTAKLAESLALVAGTNARFPRGVEFPAQIHRPGFRADWDALDGATRALEGRIAEDNRLGLGVAFAATASAQDARSRLGTLHRLAADHGQAWAAG